MLNSASFSIFARAAPESMDFAAAATPFYALLPLAMLGLPAPAPILILAVFTAVLIYIRHHENIARLLKGAEPKIGAKKA